MGNQVKGNGRGRGHVIVSFSRKKKVVDTITSPKVTKHFT